MINPEFKKELVHLIARYGLGKDANTPCDILADVMMDAYYGFWDNVERRDKRKNMQNGSESEKLHGDKEEDPSKNGYIVVKPIGPHGEHHAFVEFRNKHPLITNSANLAMSFRFRGMAETIAEQLGDGWEVVDLDTLKETKDTLKRLLDCIFHGCGQENKDEDRDADEPLCTRKSDEE